MYSNQVKNLVNIKAPLINCIRPLAYRLFRNQGAILKACVRLSKTGNAECGTACRPRRACPEAHSCGVALLAKGYGHYRQSASCTCTLQITQRPYAINQRCLKSLRYFFALSAVASVQLTAVFAQQNTELPDLPNSYTSYENIVTLPAGREMGSGNAIDVDSEGNIWVFERCGANTCTGSDVDPILKFGPDGNLLTSFGAGMFVFPHGIVLDADDNVWIVDAGVEENTKGNQIFKFNQRDELLLELGQPGVRGETNELFNEPSDLAIAPNGDIYVVDGHIAQRSNGRIVHLSPEGEFIEAWGNKGDGPLEFDCPHSIAIDSQGRIFVGDRTNNRIQILSPNGEYIDEWTQFGRPSGVRILNDVLYVVDSESRAIEGQYGYNPGFHRGIRIGSVNDGIVREFIPDPGPHGGTSFPEGIAVDEYGQIWGLSVGDHKASKFVRN